MSTRVYLVHSSGYKVQVSHSGENLRELLALHPLNPLHPQSRTDSRECMHDNAPPSSSPFILPRIPA